MLSFPPVNFFCKLACSYDNITLAFVKFSDYFVVYSSHLNQALCQTIYHHNGAWKLNHYKVVIVIMAAHAILTDYPVQVTAKALLFSGFVKVISVLLILIQ